MAAELYADMLRREGFQLIGRLDYRLHLTVWWNPAPDKLMQVILLNVGHCTLINGDKSYHLKSVSTEGETWTRDIGLLHDYLEGHFPELRISFSHFRDVPPALAQTEVRRRMAVDAPTRTIPTVEQIAELQRQLQARQQDIHATDRLMALSTTRSSLLSGYMHQQSQTKQRQIEQLQDQIERQQQRLSLFQHLQREYERKGSAAAYSFSINSNIQCVENPPQFQDALRAIVKELNDMHRYQVTQKLGGGRLNIQVAEAKEPAIVWIEHWMGGALTPMQMRKLSPEFDLVRRADEEHLVVTPDDDIDADGHVRHTQKHLAARFVSDMLQRLDKTPVGGQKAALSPENLPPDTLPLTLGVFLDAAGKATGPAMLPLTQMVHTYVSGTTGSGKSFLARVLIEEAAAHKQLSILVLDPRNQSIGILVAEDRPKILQQYEEYGMKTEGAHGFGFSYFAPGLAYASPLPRELSSLAQGRSIVSFKGLDDERRCALAGQILSAVFEACNAEESESPRLLIVVDEAQLFTRKRLDESARHTAAQAERALDKIAREGRKFGIVLVLISQTMKDFAYELASIRQMTTAKIFLRNSDREIEYASDIIGDGRLLVRLPTGVAIMHHADWGVLRIRVRPPRSKVFELREAEIRRLVACEKDSASPVTSDARKLLAVIKEHGSETSQPLNMSRAADLIGITSKRKLLEIVSELERAGLIRTRKLPERGRPRVIQLVTESPNVSSDPADGTGTAAAGG